MGTPVFLPFSSTLLAEMSRFRSHVDMMRENLNEAKHAYWAVYNANFQDKGHPDVRKAAEVWQAWSDALYDQLSAFRWVMHADRCWEVDLIPHDFRVDTTEGEPR